jgi:DNA primase
VRKHGNAGWNELLGGAIDFTEFAFSRARSTSEREEALRRLVNALAGVRDEIRRGLYLRDVAAHAGMREETVLAAVRQELRRREGRAPREGSGAGASAGAAGAGAGDATGRKHTVEDAERELLRLLLIYPDLHREFGADVEVGLFVAPEHRSIAELLIAGKRSEAVEAATGMLVEREIDSREPDEEDETEATRLRRRAVHDYLKHLRAQACRRSIHDLKDQIRGEQSGGVMNDAALALLRETLELKRKEVGLGEARNPDGIHI